MSGDFALWIIDVQERLFPKIFENDSLKKSILFAIHSTLLIKKNVFFSQQSTQLLGQTIKEISEILTPSTHPWEKTAFSGVKEKTIFDWLEKHTFPRWVLIGIEAHICVLQTAKDLKKLGKEVIILKDGVGSRREEEKIAALDELAQMGIRITTGEAFFYEEIGNSNSPFFPQFLSLVKNREL